ncbi:tRNA dihydrouridine synthase DusB [candidate division KSB1 bacterium]|nr:tRNA dihydrouridine synthase DusB [candidate division KSB1 bacterium]
MFIRNVRIQGHVAFAPLAGISDRVYRLICKRQGAAIVFSEMISAEGLVRDDEKTRRYLNFREEERPIAIQLFGANPDSMAEAAVIAESYAPDVIDINLGCPVKKVVKRGAGSALLKDPDLLARLVTSVVHATKLPVSAKIRSGWDEHHINAVEIARLLEDCGVAALTVHPRTGTQLYRGQSDWDIIRKVKEAVSIPVIGNGDIKTPSDAKQMMEMTNCDVVMIGRASYGNPWIFNQVENFLTVDKLIPPVTLDQRLSMCLEHLHLAVEEYGEHAGVRAMRKHLAWYLKNLPFCSTIKTQVVTASELASIKQLLIEYFMKIKHIHEHEYGEYHSAGREIPA